MRTVAVVLAGGTGQRFGGGMPKQLHTLAGKTIIEHSVAAFHQAAGVDAIMIVMPAGLAGQAREMFTGGGYPKVTHVIEGGTARTDSTRCAIAALDDEECDVLFHDAVDTGGYGNHYPGVARAVAEIGAGWDPQWHQPTDVYATYSDADFRLGLNAAQTTLGAVGRLAGATLAP